MAVIRPDDLAPVVARLAAAANEKLTAPEYREICQMAQGNGCLDAARTSGAAYETLRTRRKRVYHKLRLAGANEVTAALLGVALQMLAAPVDAGPGLRTNMDGASVLRP